MKITKYGSIRFTEQGAVSLEGWGVLAEPTDPTEATHEQMLLETVIPFAQKKMNEAIMTNLRRISKEKKAANPIQNPTMYGGSN